MGNDALLNTWQTVYFTLFYISRGLYLHFIKSVCQGKNMFWGLILLITICVHRV